jgi:capsular exopolysaccharide synthesis family protein
VSRIQKVLERARQQKSSIASVDEPESLSKSARRRRLQVKPHLSQGDGPRLSELNISHLSASAAAVRQNRVITGIRDRQSGVINCYKMLRTKVLRRLVANQVQVLAVTSTSQGEGKSLTALNLALSISQDPNFDVVLVDADLRSPSLHKILGIEPKMGLCEYLAGSANLEDILVSLEESGIGLIPNTHPVENSAESLTGARMSELMDSLGGLSPSVIVIVDMPPLIVDDVLAFAPFIDAMLLVFRAGVTSRADVAAAKEITTDLPVLGCVLNGAEGPKHSVYY